MTSEYTITVLAERMPNASEVFLGIKAKIKNISEVECKPLSISELSKLTGVSRGTVDAKCKHLKNHGTEGKKRYNKQDALSAINGVKTSVGRPRKN